MNIGLLEDDADTAEYLAIALDMAGHIVHTYADGSTFLQTLFAAQGQPAPLPYELLLVDLTLAGTMSGQEVIEALQQDASTQQLPIIVISAMSWSTLQDIQARYPRVRVLQKPFRLQALLHLIDTTQ
jgi:DNA-binding response OmpR family regulator